MLNLRNLTCQKLILLFFLGGSLLMRGLRETTADLDLCVSKELARQIDLYNAPKDEKGFFTPFENCQMKDDFEDFEFDVVDGYRCETLESILEFKKKANRPKDQVDIREIELALKK